ncbi:MAG: hypothetical protein DHS20C15_03390 [Planctomycetota bacterium]|nr:MAG: hypothetical protein DHS20C15_03390 [Planctomycetota bacterium]
MKRLILALVVTIGLCYLLLRVVDVPFAEVRDEVTARMQNLRLLPLLGAFLIYASTYVARGFRLGLLLPGRQRLVHLTAVAARHNLLNLVLPMRSGEASLPWMLRREAGVPWAQGAAALVLARVLDMTGLAFWACVGLAWYGLGSGPGEQVQSAARGVLLTLVLGLLVMRPVASWAAGRLTGRASWIGFVRNVAELVAGLSPGRLAGALFVSLLTWCATYAVYWLLIGTLADPGGDAIAQELAGVDFARSLVGTTGLHMTSVLPVNTVGGAGVWEGAWVAGYTLLAGLEQNAALISGIVAHLCNLVFLAVLGALGYALRGTGRAQRLQSVETSARSSTEGDADLMLSARSVAAPRLSATAESSSRSS